MTPLRRTTLPAALVVAALAAAGVPSAGAATKVRTVKGTSGTTTLTLSSAAVANLQSMGVTMTGLAPATTSGNVLTFPITKATAKVKGKEIVSGRIVHAGSLSMAHDTTQLAVSKPTVTFGSKPTLAGTMQGMSIDIGTLRLTKAKVVLSSKTLKVSKVGVRLTDLAANAMNAAFGVTGFKAGDDIGTATMVIKIKK